MKYRVLVPLWLTVVLTAQPTREQRWGDDLTFYFDTLKRLHPSLQTTPAGWDDAVTALRGRVATLTDAQILVEANRVTARLGDAHTNIYYLSQNGFRFLPLRLRWLSDGFYVVQAGGRALPALGQRVRAIAGVPADELFTRARAALPHENVWWARAQAPAMMISPDILHGLGALASANDPVSVELQNGTKLDLVLEGVALTSFPRKGRSLWPLNERSPGLFYWYDYLPEAKALYVKYNVCREDPALPMAAFTAELITVAAAERPDRIVFDFRHNGGGDEGVFLNLLAQLGAALEAGRFPLPAKGAFVIIGRQSFSSAVGNAVSLKQGGVILVGEPTGGKPSGPGNVVSFAMPNSRAIFQVSTQVFVKEGFETVESLTPDIAVDLTIQDVANETDPYLAIILR